MKLFIMLFTLIGVSQVSLAHCPLEIKANGVTYCTEIEWQMAEQKINGDFLESPTLSPVLIESGIVPPLWLFSKAQFSFWKSGDAQHLAQEIHGLRIFPYMQMSSGHHHSASYEFLFDSGTKTYQIKSIAFTEMDGCWSLRWTTQSTDDAASSTELVAVTAFTNVAKQNTFCKEASGEPAQGHHHH